MSAIAITVLFFQPLSKLIVFAAQSDLHSHILLIPLVSAYLLCSRRSELPAAHRRSVVPTSVLAMFGAAALASAFAWQQALSLNDWLSLATFAYLCFVSAAGFLFFGARFMAAVSFPVLFLFFMVPLPDAGVNWLERASVLASTQAAALYFNLAGTPLVRHGTVFELPGIVLQVGQECSGIRSSWVLFITSVLAAHLFFRSRWRQFALVAFVIPLGILRNGFRILVIGLLCVHVGPHMIDSPIHHRGGPLFFALSLVPLFLFAWWLRRGDSATTPAALEEPAGPVSGR